MRYDNSDDLDGVSSMDLVGPTLCLILGSLFRGCRKGKGRRGRRRKIMRRRKKKTMSRRSQRGNRRSGRGRQKQRSSSGPDHKPWDLIDLPRDKSRKNHIRCLQINNLKQFRIIYVHSCVFRECASFVGLNAEVVERVHV